MKIRAGHTLDIVVCGIIVFTLFHGTPDGCCKHQLHFFAERGRISETSGFDPRIVLFLPIPTRTKFQIIPGYSVSQAEPLDTTFFNTAHSKFKAGAIAAVLSSIMSCHPGSFRNSFSKLNMGPWINIFPNHCHFNSWGACSGSIHCSLKSIVKSFLR